MPQKKMSSIVVIPAALVPYKIQECLKSINFFFLVCSLTQSFLPAADSVGGRLEGVVCSWHRAMGHSGGFYHSSCRFWYVNKAPESSSHYRPTDWACVDCDNRGLHERLSCLMTCSPQSFVGMNTENTESQRMNKIISEIQALQEVVTRFRQMRLDATEFACLKCIVTFKAGECFCPICRSFN